MPAWTYSSLGATAVWGDPQDEQTLRQWCEGKDAVVDLRVRIPGGARAALPWAWREYRRLRGPEAGRLASAARDAGVGVLVRDTVTMIDADGGEEVLTESAPVDAHGTIAANIAAEQHVAGFTAAGGTGVVAALTAPAGVYNVVDDEPLRRAEWIALLAESVGRASLRQPPAFATTVGGPPLRSLARSQRVSAARFREVTGWRPSVPSRRVGWPTVASGRVSGRGCPVLPRAPSPPRLPPV